MTRRKLAVAAAVIVAAFLGGVVGQFLIGPPQQAWAQYPGYAEKVVAQEFIVVDKDGTGRIDMKLSENGWPMLRMTDKKGQTVLLLSVTPDSGPGLILIDPNAKLRLCVQRHPVRGPEIQMLDEKGRQSVVAINCAPATAPTGLEAGNIILYSPRTGEAIGMLTGLSGKGGMLVLSSEQGTPLWAAPAP